MASADGRPVSSAMLAVMKAPTGGKNQVNDQMPMTLPRIESGTFNCIVTMPMFRKIEALKPAAKRIIKLISMTREKENRPIQQLNMRAEQSISQEPFRSASSLIIARVPSTAPAPAAASNNPNWRVVALRISFANEGSRTT